MLRSAPPPAASSAPGTEPLSLRPISPWRQPGYGKTSPLKRPPPATTTTTTLPPLDLKNESLERSPMLVQPFRSDGMRNTSRLLPVA